MHPAIESFLRGAPFLLEHFGVTLAMLIIGAVIYILITPQQEIKLIREGNTAAALSMGGQSLHWRYLWVPRFRRARPHWTLSSGACLPW